MIFGTDPSVVNEERRRTECKMTFFEKFGTVPWTGDYKQSGEKLSDLGSAL